MLSQQARPWLIVAVGAAVVGVLYWASKAKASPALPVTQRPSAFNPAPVPTPAQPVPAPVATSGVTSVKQVDPVVYNQKNQAWMMGADVYKGSSFAYQLFFLDGPTTTPPSASQWAASIASNLGVSPSLVSVSA